MDTTTIVYNSYYQWVPLYLIFLALLFYLPRWKMGVKQSNLGVYFSIKDVLDNDGRRPYEVLWERNYNKIYWRSRREKRQTCIFLYQKHPEQVTSFLHKLLLKLSLIIRYNIYFCGFITCEALNLFVVILQFLLTHRFLHYRYFLYGFNVSFYSTSLKWFYKIYL